MVTRAIARAQKKVEDYHFEIRKNLLEYDEVMDQQRKEIYAARQEVPGSDGAQGEGPVMLGPRSTRRAQTFFEDPRASRLVPAHVRRRGRAGSRSRHAQERHAAGRAARAVRSYDEREAELGPRCCARSSATSCSTRSTRAGRTTCTRSTPCSQGIGLRGYAQVDPKNEYKREGFLLFDKLRQAIEEEITGLVLRIEVRREPPPQAKPSGCRRRRCRRAQRRRGGAQRRQRWIRCRQAGSGGAPDDSPPGTDAGARQHAFDCIAASSKRRRPRSAKKKRPPRAPPGAPGARQPAAAAGATARARPCPRPAATTLARAAADRNTRSATARRPRRVAAGGACGRGPPARRRRSCATRARA
jgi:preprotein translocase subunit SecA